MRGRMQRPFLLTALVLLIPACGPGSNRHETSTGGATGTDNHPPSVAIVQPPLGVFFIQGEEIDLQASATDTDGFVTQVEFFNGTTLLGTSTVLPFRFTWTAAVPGSYSLTAVATDNEGASAASDPVRVDIFSADNTGATRDIPPVVNLSNPQDGATFHEGTPIQLIADAQDGDGTVIQVDFMEGSTVLGSQRLPPFIFTWTGTGPGTFSLRAVATDDARISTSSTPIRIVVLPNPVDTTTGVTIVAPR